MNSVVLPAPLGPMRAQMVPGSMSKVSPSRATTPPKRDPHGIDGEQRGGRTAGDVGSFNGGIES